MSYKRFVEQVYPRRVIGFSSLGLADSHAAVTLAESVVRSQSSLATLVPTGRFRSSPTLTC